MANGFGPKECIFMFCDRCVPVVMPTCGEGHIDQENIKTNHHNEMFQRKIWNARGSRNMHKEVILLESKRPIDLTG